MKKSLRVIALLAAIALAGSAAWAAKSWLQDRADAIEPIKVPMASVVVAGQDLMRGKMLSADNLVVQQWPVSHLPKGHFSKPSDLDRRVLKAPLAANELVLESKLAPPGSMGGLSGIVPRGYRAMTVKVDDVIGVGGFVLPGDRVDVMVTMSRGAYRKNPISRVLLQDILVLTAGVRVEDKKGKAQPTSRKMRVVTLQVTPEQGEMLVLAAGEGRLALALRNSQERGQHHTRGTRLTSMMLAGPEASTDKAAPAAAKKSKPRFRLEVIRGQKRQIVHF